MNTHASIQLPSRRHRVGLCGECGGIVGVYIYAHRKGKPRFKIDVHARRGDVYALCPGSSDEPEGEPKEMPVVIESPENELRGGRGYKNG